MTLNNAPLPVLLLRVVPWRLPQKNTPVRVKHLPLSLSMNKLQRPHSRRRYLIFSSRKLTLKGSRCISPYKTFNISSPWYIITWAWLKKEMGWRSDTWRAKPSRGNSKRSLSRTSCDRYFRLSALWVLPLLINRLGPYLRLLKFTWNLSSTNITRAPQWIRRQKYRRSRLGSHKLRTLLWSKNNLVNTVPTAFL